MFALPAVDLLKNCVTPRLAVPMSVLVMAALPAVDLSKNCVTPPALLVMTAPAAVALFENTIVPGLFPKVSATVMKVWLTPELFVMPAPLMVSVKLGLTVMLYAEAAGVNVMPFTSVFVEIATSLVFDKPNVATSADPLGTVAGLQLVLIFQSSERGLRFHVALPAWADPTRESIRPQPTTGAISFFLKRNSGVAVLR